MQASIIVHNTGDPNLSRVLLADQTIDPGEVLWAVDTNVYIGGEYCIVELAGAVDRNTVRITMQTYFRYSFSLDERETVGPLLEGR